MHACLRSASGRYLVPILILLISAGCLQVAHSHTEPAPFGQDVLSCSTAPCVLPVTEVLQERMVNAAVSVNPLNTNTMMLGADQVSCDEGGGFELSTDGGSTWKFSTCMANVQTQKREYYAYGQPMVGYDLNGNAYIAEEFQDTKGLGHGAIGVETSSDGLNWSPTRVALNGGEKILEYSWLAVDANPQSPRANTLYVSSIEGWDPGRTQVFSAHSTDGGIHWFPAAVGSPQSYPALDIWTNVATGKDGSVYVTWQHCAFTGPHAGCQDGTAFMLFCKSTDGGITWTEPVIVAKITLSPTLCDCGIGMLPNTANNILISNNAVIGVDNGNSPYVGNIYVAMYSWTGTYMRVQVVCSTDGGNTWSPPVPVAPPSATHDQFLPWISVSKTGVIGVTWMDRRNDPADVEYQPFAAFSRDGGLSFGTNVVLNQKFSNPLVAGNTWSEPRVMTTAVRVGPIPNTAIYPTDNAVIGVDNSDGAYAGNIYVALYSWTGTYMQVQVVRSTDGGNTWSIPVPVAPSSATHDQFPWLSVSTTGLVGLTWLDRRNDPANIKYQAFAAVSRDGGLSFQPNIPLASKFSDPNVNGTDWMGNYATNNTWVGSNFFAAWVDSSNGIDMQDVVGGIKLR